MNIVMSSDERYSKHLEVVLLSSAMNASDSSELHFHILDGGLSEKSKSRIEAVTYPFGCGLTFHSEVQPEYADYSVTSERMSTTAYYRISIPDMLPKTAERALYLDCDLVVEDDLLQLDTVSFQETEGIAAVQDISRKSIRGQRKTPGVPPGCYFNSGVLLFNLPFWRLDNTSQKVREYKLKYSDVLTTNDQCALNGVLWKNWRRLSPSWNQQSGIYRQRVGDRSSVGWSKEDIKKAISSPKIIHYVGRRKPWLIDCPHPLRHRYHYYREMIDSNYQRPKFYETLAACARQGTLRHLFKTTIVKKFR